MGSGCVYKCSACGYSFEASVGVGFLYPDTYQETMAAARRGELGEKVQQFLSEHPDGALDPSDQIACCLSCKRYETVQDLTMYFFPDGLPEPPGRWSIAFPAEGENYVDPGTMQQQGKIYARYPHRCHSCGGKMKLLKRFSFQPLPCPNCRGKDLEPTRFIDWD